MVARRNARDGGGPPRPGPPVREEQRASDRPPDAPRSRVDDAPPASAPPTPHPPNARGKTPRELQLSRRNSPAHSMPIGSRPRARPNTRQRPRLQNPRNLGARRIGPAGTDPRPRRGHVTSHVTNDGPEIGAPGRSAGPGQTNAPRAGPARPRDDVRRCFQHASPRLSHRTAVSSSCPKRGALSVPRGAPFRSQERRPSCPK